MKIGFVGCGMVGATAAYSFVLRGVGSEVVLVDANPDFAAAQAEDILHATPVSHPMMVTDGRTEDLSGAAMVVLAAGVSQKPGETRLDLLQRNAAVFRDIIPGVLDAAPDCILVIATNPVDIMTHIAAGIAADSHGIAPARVIGSGTILDTARYRTLLGRHLGVSPHSIHGYVLGEHGDSEVLNWSGTMVGSIRLSHYAERTGRVLDDAVRNRIDEGVRGAAGRIIAGKGATWFGIGAGLARIGAAVLDNEKALLTCSIVTPEICGVKNVALSLPRVIGRGGVVETILPDIDDAETDALHNSATVLRKAADEIGL